jgi:hypothetical protein
MVRQRENDALAGRICLQIVPAVILIQHTSFATITVIGRLRRQITGM